MPRGWSSGFYQRLQCTQMNCDERDSFLLVRRVSSSVGLSKSLVLFNAGTAGNTSFRRSRAERSRKETAGKLNRLPNMSRVSGALKIVDTKSCSFIDFYSVLLCLFLEV